MGRPRRVPRRARRGAFGREGDRSAAAHDLDADGHDAAADDDDRAASLAASAAPRHDFIPASAASALSAASARTAAVSDDDDAGRSPAERYVVADAERAFRSADDAGAASALRPRARSNARVR